MSITRTVLRGIMKAVRVSEFGGPGVLKVESNVPIPQPGDNQILVKVSAAGVNPVDTYIRAGTYSIKPQLPYTPGFDVSGVVEKVGAAVTKFKPGDRVYGVRTVNGSFAEYTVVEDPFVAHLPDNVTFDEGAGMGIPNYTAYRALVLHGKARPGETVLVHGASGGVGVAACQIARALGLQVLGTAGTPAGIQLALNNGAHQAFNHREEGYIDKIMAATNGEGPDVILEMLANVNLEKDLTIIKTNGRIVNIGSRGTIEISPRFTMGKECIITGVLLMSATPSQWTEMHAALYAGLEKGWLKPHIGKSYKLEEASQSHEDIMQASGHTGRLIIHP